MKPAKKGRRSTAKRSSSRTVIIEILLAIIVLFIIFTSVFKITEFFLNPTETPFPKMEVFLADVPIEKIDQGSKSTIYKNNSVHFSNQDDSFSFDNVEIKGRGNSTWAQIKKPYQIKLSEKFALLNKGEAKKWILLANYFDDSHLRNNAAFYLQHLLNITNPVDAQYVELYIDNNYRGLYYLTEKIEIEKDRINLQDPFGIIVEINNLHTYTKEFCSTSTSQSCTYECAAIGKNKDCFTIHDVVNKDNTADSVNMIISKIHELEEAIDKQDYNQITSLIDVDSFVKYFLVNEFANNVDAYGTNLYFYMNGENDLLHVGPSWDFDSAFGNKKLFMDGIDQSIFSSPTSRMIFRDLQPTHPVSDKVSGPHWERLSSIFFDLMDISEFSDRVKSIYQKTISGHLDDFTNYLQEQANYIHQAALRDQARWKYDSDFNEEVKYLIDWITERYEFFEQTYGANSEMLESQEP